MAENSKIEWTDHTFNPWIGCTKVSPGCDHCYAEARMDTRLHVVHWGAGMPRKRTTPANWRQPERWNRQAAAEGRRFRVFCASLADVFDNEVDPQWRRDLFALIDKTPHLDWLLLTKRIGNAEKMMREACGFHEPNPGCYQPRPNLWLGASIVNQAEADRDIPKLLATPAAVRFLSMEPLLGPVDLRAHLYECCGSPVEDTGGEYMGQRETVRSCCCEFQRTGLDWVIVGGESGHGARPMHPEWARSLRDQCAAAGVAFLFKQWGEWSPLGLEQARDCAVDHDGRVAEPLHLERFPVGAEAADGWTRMYRVGKHEAGRLLDGSTHDGYPGA